MRRRLLPLSALLLAAAVPGAAQSSAAASASIQVPPLLRIDIVDPDVAFPSPTMEDFEAGFIAAGEERPRVRTRANVPHRLQVAAASATLQGTAGGSKPVQDLQWSADGLTWAGLDTEAADVAHLSAGAHASAADLHFRLLLDLDRDLPDTYQASLVFTAVAQ